MGLTKDLNLQGNDFSNIATFLFVGLLCFEVPNSKRCITPCHTGNHLALTFSPGVSLRSAGFPPRKMAGP